MGQHKWCYKPKYTRPRILPSGRPGTYFGGVEGGGASSCPSFVPMSPSSHSIRVLWHQRVASFWPHFGGTRRCTRWYHLMRVNTRSRSMTSQGRCGAWPSRSGAHRSSCGSPSKVRYLLILRFSYNLKALTNSHHQIHSLENLQISI